MFQCNVGILDTFSGILPKRSPSSSYERRIAHAGVLPCRGLGTASPQPVSGDRCTLTGTGLGRDESREMQKQCRVSCPQRAARGTVQRLRCGRSFCPRGELRGSQALRGPPARPASPLRCQRTPLPRRSRPSSTSNGQMRTCHAAPAGSPTPALRKQHGLGRAGPAQEPREGTTAQSSMDVGPPREATGRGAEATRRGAEATGRGAEEGGAASPNLC